MKLKREVLIDLIVKYKNVFNEIVDYVDQHGGNLDIPQSLYINRYNTLIVGCGDRSAERNLTLNSLFENRIFFSEDKANSTFSVHSFLIELLRFMDVSRSRELADSDFERIRLDFQGMVDTFDQIMFPSGHPQFDEAQVTLLDLINTTLSKIQSNIEALEYQANTLAERYNKLDLDGMTRSDSIKLLEDAQYLYNRFVIPCLEFLSSKPMKGTSVSFIASISRLSSMQEARGNFYLAGIISSKAKSIHSYYKDIHVIHKRIHRYCTSLAEERVKYRAIESSYNELMKSIDSLRHGKGTGFLLSNEALSFVNGNTLSGMKAHNSNYKALINISQESTRFSLDEWLESQLETYRREDKKVLKEYTPPAPESDEYKERRKIVVRYCRNHDFCMSMDDVIQSLHNILKNNIEGYSLIDVRIAREYLMGNSTISERLNVGLKSNKLIYEGYYFKYLQWSLEDEEVLSHGS